MSAVTFAESLIAAVRKNRILWDITDKRYYNRVLVDREWGRIATELCDTKETVKAKWKNLRDTFTKEMKKVRKSRSGDDAEPKSHYTGLWCHFESMQFLKSISTLRTVEDNLSDPEDNAITFQEEQLSILPSCQVIEECSSNTPTDKERKKESGADTERNIGGEVTVSRISRKRKSTQFTDAFDRESLQPEAKRIDLWANDDDDDEDINFFKSLLPHVRRLPPLNKLYFRTNLQTVLIDELSKVENQNRTSNKFSNISRPTSNVSTPCQSPISLVDCKIEQPGSTVCNN